MSGLVHLDLAWHPLYSAPPKELFLREQCETNLNTELRVAGRFSATALPVVEVLEVPKVTSKDKKGSSSVPAVVLECVVAVQGFHRGNLFGFTPSQASPGLVLQCLGCSCQVPVELKVQGTHCRHTLSPNTLPGYRGHPATSNHHLPQPALHRAVPWD